MVASEWRARGDAVALPALGDRFDSRGGAGGARRGAEKRQGGLGHLVIIATL